MDATNGNAISLPDLHSPDHHIRPVGYARCSLHEAAAGPAARTPLDVPEAALREPATRTAGQQRHNHNPSTRALATARHELPKSMERLMARDSRMERVKASSLMISSPDVRASWPA